MILTSERTFKEEKPRLLKEETEQQQDFKIKGKVTDGEGKPLPGATITIVGTTRGVITDTDGTYSIDANPADKLVFSFIGMESQIVDVGNQKKINIQLKEKSEELEDVTVVAFGKQKKESVLSSIQTVKAEDLKVPSSNLTTSFAGRMAGVISYQRSGEPGEDNAQFFIRGVTTFGTGKADPLILIDNVELSSTDLARLNPDDIQSFSILKDATATALYGARGANGVILVTTKEGKEGKAKVSARFENSFSMPTKNVKIADPITFMEMHNDAVRTRDPLSILPYSNTKIANTKAGVNKYVYPAVDWNELLMRNFTENQRFNFNVSGGGKISKYYITASYTQDNGILKTDPRNEFDNNIDLKKYLVRSNININLTKSTKVTLRTHGTFDDYSGPVHGGAELYRKTLRANPVLFPAWYEPDENNKYTNHILFGNYGEGGTYLNPYAEMVKGHRDYSSTMVLMQVEIQQDLNMITKGLSARVLGSTTRNSYFDVERYYGPYYYSVGSYNKETDTYTLSALNPEDGHEYLTYNEGGKTVDRTQYLEASVMYNRTFLEGHDVSGMLVYTAREFLSGNAGSLQSSLAHRNLGLAGRFTYGYNDRYFAEFNFGYNGSERFDKNNRFGFFPSVGIGWFVSNEMFWNNSLKRIFSKLKLKATYGKVGNDEIGNSSDRFFYLSEVNMNNGGRGYSFGTNWGYYKNGVSISRYANEDIGWEIAYKTNLGIELGMFNKIDVQVDLYHELRTNILLSRTSIPSTMGLQATPSANIGEASGHGVDISVDYQQVFSNNFWITARGNFTYAASKYKKHEEPDYQNTPWRSHIGHSLSQTWGYVAERLFVDDEEVENSPEQQFGEYMGGDIKFKDINGDGLIDEQDQVALGYPTSPEIIYGFGVSAGFKGFDASCFFQGSARSSFWISSSDISPFVDTESSAIGNNALLQFIADSHWSEENQDIYAQWPRLSAYTIDNNNQTSSWFMRNGAFLRLKSAEFGYTLPSNLISKLKLEKVRFYLSGTNLMTFSKFKLWDPEMGGSGLGYPVQKVFNLGLQVQF